MTNRTEELDKEMRKRMREDMERHEHSVSAMHANIKQHDMHLNAMHSGNHKFQVKSARQLEAELK